MAEKRITKARKYEKSRQIRWVTGSTLFQGEFIHNHRDRAGVEQAKFYRRAAWWYEKALLQATGLLRTKLEKRLDTIKAGKTP